ncbi:MAG: O-antigen ligase family protein [Paeniclostridium sordellii]|nr:O-antigen ligase family protein [Paeniclostridium sordellii]
MINNLKPLIFITGSFLIGIMSSISIVSSGIFIIMLCILTACIYDKTNIATMYFLTLSLFPILIIGQQISIILLPIFLIIFIINFIIYKHKKLKIYNISLILIFYSLNILSLLISSNINYAIQNIGKLTACILIYISTVNLEVITRNYDLNTIKKILKYIILTSAIVCTVLIYKYIFVYRVKYVGINLIYETEAGKNQLAFFLATLLPFCIFCSYKNYKKIWNIILKISSIILIIAAILSNSRGVIVSVIVSSIITAIITNDKKIIRYMFLAVGLIIIFIIINSKENQIIYSNTIGSNQIRLSLIKFSIKTFLENLVIGIGIGDFYQIPRYIGLNVLISHNDYLQIMVELGICGIILFMGIMYNFLRNLLSIKSIIDKKDMRLYQSILCSNISIMIYLLFINSYNIILVWFIFGISMKVYDSYIEMKKV